MKQSLVTFAFAFMLFSCQKTTETKEIKTAYIDTTKLMETYNESKDIDSKYKNKTEVMGNELEVEIKKFKQDAANFQKIAQSKGQEWAQQNGAALQQRQEKLQYAQQAIVQQMQQEMGVEKDSMVNEIKRVIKKYGKENGYAYIYGTGEANTVLYAEDKYDITKDIIKLLNDKYSSKPKTTEKEVSKSK